MKVREASAEGTTKKLTAEKSIHIRPASIESRGGFGHF
jgi:IS30 family transposase